jgi:hypothetical protein
MGELMKILHQLFELTLDIEMKKMLRYYIVVNSGDGGNYPMLFNRSLTPDPCGFA